MDNPFKKRATEYFEDPASLIAVLSPEPLRRFFDGNATSYFDRLVTIVGTPGSGKTTIARLIEFDTVITLLQSSLHSKDHKELAEALGDCEILVNSRPKILACRLAATSDFRNIWELPYSKKVRNGLLRSLIQVRAVLGWLRKLERVGVDLSRIRILTRPQSEVQSLLIHTHDPAAFRTYARNVEEKIFKIITALLPPDESELSIYGLGSTYEAFQIIESFLAPSIPGIQENNISLRPLCIIDDAHELHPDQYTEVDAWFKSREIKIARWLMTRVDAIGPETLRKALQIPKESTQFGTTKDRDWIIRLMQRGPTEKRAYRATVKDIARRYIDQMPLLRRRGIQLENCLAAQPAELSANQLKSLEKNVASVAKKSGFTNERLEFINSWLPPRIRDDERLALMRILLHREMRRTPQSDLFAIEAPAPETILEPRSVGTALVSGANLQLFHEFGKPFYYSFDRLADASGENIEQFIHLAGVLVGQIETRVIRGRDPNLDAKAQNSILLETAKEAIRNWNFPHSTEVKRLIEFIAKRCIDKTLAPNAPLDDGANAFGIPQSDMDRFQKDGGKLVPALHYALAYNAITLTEDYECKRKTWCLIQLGGLPILANGLTFSRGGFCEGTLAELIDSVAE